MEKYINCGLSAKFMAELAKVNPSTISRIIHSYKTATPTSKHRRNIKYVSSDTRKILGSLIANKRKISPNKKVHAFYNFKGGTGKTSLCYQVATHLALCGYRVLAVDTDAQSHLTVSFGLLDNLSLKTLYDGVVNNMHVDDLIVPIFVGLDLIPSNLSLTKLEIHLREKTRNENFISRYMDFLKTKYDFIIFDSNPNVTLLNRNILCFADNINIVCETHPYSVHGMKLVMEDMHEFYNIMELRTPNILIIPNKYEDRSTTSAEAMSALVQNYGDYLIPNFAVRKCEDFPKSARDRLPISFFCKKNSIAFEDIKDLIHIIIESCEIKNN